MELAKEKGIKNGDKVVVSSARANVDAVAIVVQTRQLGVNRPFADRVFSPVVRSALESKICELLDSPVVALET